MSENKKAIHRTDWPDMRTVCEEYKISMDELAQAIEQRGIKTRGHQYDEISQRDFTSTRADGFIDIPEEKWAEYIFEETIDDLRDNKKRYFTFLYGFQWLPFAGVSDVYENRTGYADIQVNRADFESKVKIKTLPNGKRVHKQIEYIRLIYDKVKKRRGTDKVKAEDVLEYAREHYSSGTHDFEITDIEEHPTDKRKSVLYFEGAGLGDGERNMTFGRFYNIISSFNNPKPVQ